MTRAASLRYFCAHLPAEDPGQAGGESMTDRKTLVNDMTEMETLILDLEGVTPCGYSEKRCVLAICRCLWHILEYLIRRDK